MPGLRPRDVAVFLLLAALALPPATALAVADIDAPLAAEAELPPSRPVPEEVAARSIAGTVAEIGIETAPATGRLVFAPATPPSTVSGADLRFECPPGPANGEAPIIPQTGTPSTNVIRASCPFRVIDEQDLLGSPQIAVRHDDPREIAFFSLHGAATTDGPTPRSRDPTNPSGGRQSHSTFTSKDRGWDWLDNPFGNEGFGETHSGIMSRDGNIFKAALFSRGIGTENGTGIFDYHFVLYKENTVKDPQSHKGHMIAAREPGNVIDEVNLVLVEPATQIQTQEEYDAAHNETREERRAAYRNGSQPPSDDRDVGNYTIPRDAEDYSDDLIAAVWHEKAYDWKNASTGKSSWIDLVWTDASSRDQWHKLPDEQLIGPCRDTSNPVSHNGRVYVACVVDAGYTGRRGARIGDVDVWGIDLATEKKFLAGNVPHMSDGRPRMAANSEGRMAITSTRLVGASDPYETVSVQLSYGWYGANWESAIPIGQQLHDIWGQPVRDARITSMVLLDDNPMVYFTYMERSNVTAQGAPDPNDPTPESNAIEYHKAVAVYEYCRAQPVTLVDLQVGVVRHPFESDILPEQDAVDDPVGDVTGVFDDLHDGMQVVRDPFDQRERIYFAYGDHGVIQYGILDSINQQAAGQCVPAPPAVLFTPAPAVATPLLLSSGVGVGLGSAAGLASALGLGSLLIAKRKVAMAAAVKAK